MCLEKNQDRIYWRELACNPSIFTYNYDVMKSRNINLKEEIIEAALHPKRIFRDVKTYDDLEEIYHCYFDEDE